MARLGPFEGMLFMKKSVRLATIVAALLALSMPAAAGDYGSAPGWHPGGSTWRGHHDLYWRYRDPNFSYFTYGWGQPWSYASRGWRPAHPYVGPNPPSAAHAGAPAAWTAEWLAYCAERFRSFERDSGLYTAYSGEKRMCH